MKMTPAVLVTCWMFSLIWTLLLLIQIWLLVRARDGDSCRDISAEAGKMWIQLSGDTGLHRPPLEPSETSVSISRGLWVSVETSEVGGGPLSPLETSQWRQRSSLWLPVFTFEVSPNWQSHSRRTLRSSAVPWWLRGRPKSSVGLNSLWRVSELSSMICFLSCCVSREDFL